MISFTPEPSSSGLPTRLWWTPGPMTTPTPRRFILWQGTRRLVREQDGALGLVIPYEKPCYGCWTPAMAGLRGPGCRECGGHGGRWDADFYSLGELGVSL